MVHYFVVEKMEKKTGQLLFTPGSGKKKYVQRCWSERSCEMMLLGRVLFLLLIWKTGKVKNVNA